MKENFKTRHLTERRDRGGSQESGAPQMRNGEQQLLQSHLVNISNMSSQKNVQMCVHKWINEWITVINQVQSRNISVLTVKEKKMTIQQRHAGESEDGQQVAAPAQKSRSRETSRQRYLFFNFN